MTVYIYLDGLGKWRWRMVAGNDLIVADSGQGYASKSNARRAWRRVEEAVRNGMTVVAP